jgi:hypothetical protein
MADEAEGSLAEIPTPDDELVSWNPVFLMRQNIQLPRPNKPHLPGLLADLDAIRTKSMHPEHNRTLDMGSGNRTGQSSSSNLEAIRVFMGSILEGEDPTLSTPRADTLAEICRGSSIESLTRDEWEGEAIALVDEGCFISDAFKRRASDPCVPLTARDLYHRLQEKVK